MFNSVNMFGNILTKPRYGTYYVSNNGEDAYLYDVIHSSLEAPWAGSTTCCNC